MANSPVKLWRRQKQFSSLLGVEGEIVNFTLIRVPPKGFSKPAPYPVAIAKFKNGEKMIGQIVDYDEKDLIIGRKVEIVLRRGVVENEEDIITYLLKFKPL